MNNSDNFKLIFDKDSEDKTRQQYYTILIPKQAIIKSPKIYQKFRSKPNSNDFKINVQCNEVYEQTILDIFSLKRSLRKGFINCVNRKNVDFLIDVNKFLEIKHLGINIENYDYDEQILNEDDYQNYCSVQMLLNDQEIDDDSCYKKLYSHLELLKNMKISRNLPSLRNRMKILKRIANIRSSLYFKNDINENLDNEIQKFEKEIESTSMIEENGVLKYKSIIDIIRHDDSDSLQTYTSSQEEFNFEKLYDFDYDFTNLLPKKATLFELIVYFSALKCYSFISLNYIKKKDFKKGKNSEILKNVPKFAFASGHIILLEFCKQKELLDKKSFSTYLEILIAYQSNNLCETFIEIYSPILTLDSIRYTAISNNFVILSYLILDYGADLNIALFQAFDDDNIEMLKFLIKLKSSNINYGMDGIQKMHFFMCVLFIELAWKVEKILLNYSLV